MNVWAGALPRLLVSSRCPHNLRSLVEQSLSSNIRYFSTNTPVSTKTPEEAPSQFSELLKSALKQADSKVVHKHSAPRLPLTLGTTTINSFQKKRRKRAFKTEKKATSNVTSKTKKKATSKREKKATSKTGKKAASKEKAKPTDLLSPPTDLEVTPFPSEDWVAEPWATTTSLSQQNDEGLTDDLDFSSSPYTERPTDDFYRSSPPHMLERPTDELDRSSPPHILGQKIISEGTLVPLVTKILVDVPTVAEHLPVATLSHGLERVLFNPGVHWLRDPRSGVYNFTPWLEKIPKVNDFAFERLTGFIKSSRDEELRALAKQENKKFAGSTSSLSGMLSHIYFLISDHKEVDLSVLSQHFKNQPARFTAGQMMPATVLLNYKEGVYAIDSRTTEWDDPDKNILTWLGTLLENFLTKPPKAFRSFLRAGSDPIKDGKSFIREAYRFAKTDNFVMRSQLDCQDRRLPGTGVFDIKTRACISLRMDILNYEENSGYLIRTQHGYLESFEREYYDLIRSAFLKYSFQARIGNMDGVMVAYHNTEQIFGFQYIPIREMDERLFGPEEGVGEKVFEKSIGLLEAVLLEAAACYPEQLVRCTFETMYPNKLLTVFVQPDDWTGDEHQWPTKKLNVTVEHFLDSESVRGTTAMKSTDGKWTIKYNIGISTQPISEIQSDYRQVIARKKRLLVLPSSVAPQDAEKYWENLVFHRRESEEDEPKAAFRPEGFTTAVSASVEKYRELARAGRLDTERLAREEAGRPKIVLGEGVYTPDED